LQYNKPLAFRIVTAGQVLIWARKYLANQAPFATNFVFADQYTVAEEFDSMAVHPFSGSLAFAQSGFRSSGDNGLVYIR
jgi:hypothetical protein